MTEAIPNPQNPKPFTKIQFFYVITLDLNIDYYHIELSPVSKILYIIVLSFNKYKY